MIWYCWMSWRLKLPLRRRRLGRRQGWIKQRVMGGNGTIDANANTIFPAPTTRWPDCCRRNSSAKPLVKHHEWGWAVREVQCIETGTAGWGWVVGWLDVGWLDVEPSSFEILKCIINWHKFFLMVILQNFELRSAVVWVFSRWMFNIELYYFDSPKMR